MTLISQDKLHKRRRRKKFAFYLFFISLFVFLWCAVSFFSFSDFLTIDKFRVSGMKYESADTVSLYVENELSKNIFWFFSGQNALILRRNILQKNLSAVFPSIKDVNFDIDGFKKLSLEVVEREPSAIWCDVKCFLVDDSGLLFFPLPENTPFDLPTFYGGDSKALPGQRFVAEEEFRELSFFARGLGGMGITPHDVKIVSESEVNYIFQGDGMLIIDPQSDLSDVLSYLVALKNDRDIAFGSPEFMANLLYIDTRYGSKIVYKMK